MTNPYRTMLMFSASSRDALTMLEQELNRHSAVSTGISFDHQTFILAVECANTAAAVWDVRVTVLTLDPESTFGRQMSPPTYDRPAA